MILVSVRRITDIGLAAALHGALREQYGLFVLCADAELALACEAQGLAAGADAIEWMLNAQRVSLFVSFRASSAARQYAEMELVQFFDAIGIPTLELQHRLFQPGFDASAGTSGGLVTLGTGLDTVAPASIACAARGAIAWGGDDGVGYPRSLLYSSEALLAHARSAESCALVLTNLHADAYTAPERYRFVFALLALVAAHPEQQFVWKSHPAEALHAETQQAVGVVAEYDLPNLRIDTDTPVEQLIAAAGYAVCTLASYVIDLELMATATTIFAAEAQKEEVRALGAVPFTDAESLLQAFAQLRAQPQQGRVHSGVGPLRVGVFRAKIAAAMGTRALRADYLALALSRLPREHRAPRTSQETLSFAPVMRELSRVLDKLGTVQRSTLAYKAKRLATRFRF